QRVDITPDKGTTLSFSSSPSTGSGCKVCTRVQSERQCDVHSTFNTGPSCSSEIQTTTNYDALLSLNRKFVWNLTAAAPKSARIDFGRTGLRQIQPSESCPDKHIFTYEVFPDSGKFWWAVLPILSLPIDHFVKTFGQYMILIVLMFLALAKISVSLQQGLSSLELFSPNYPGSFPDNDVMEWYFVVPEKHKASIQLFNITQAKCLRDEAGVEYHRLAQTALLAGLTEAQPEQREGDFTMTLRNCRMERKRAGSPGLSMNFRVSASKANTPGSCADIFKPILFIYNQILLSITDCSQARTYRRSSQRHSLSIPPLPECLPAPLSNMTWSLRLPQHGTVELGCASGTLFQELPGQPCNDSISIKIAEDDGSTIGTFCRNGSITKLQIHTNITITVSGTDGNTLLPSDILHAHVKEEISERYIFRVSPREDTPLFLATPGWPKGMPPHSTVSWIVTVPPKMEAHLRFTELNQPKCSKRHTNIHVQRLGSLEEEYSRREDETPEYDIKVSESFYLNMSNCMPVKDYFSVLTKVTLKKNQLMTIIVAIVAVLLVIFIAVLVYSLILNRKKKKKLNHQVSIYNPNGTSFLPGQNGFPKSQEDDEYHIYDDIQDSLVYSHLLRKGAEMGIYGDFDSEPSHSDSQQPLEARESDAGGDIEVSEYQGFSEQENPKLPPRNASHVQPMVDNDLYEMGVSEGERSPSLGPRLDPDGGELTP
uniref:CUB domain containing protein 1a n=1 Tax=Neogobius melanostomus TaxID=47308 RepID=A0A8C6SRA2_9GOBI